MRSGDRHESSRVVVAPREGLDRRRGERRSPLRIALIGCGGIAHDHVRAIHQLASRLDVELAAVCDRSPATARWFGDRYGASWFTDAKTMLGEVEPDVVHVLTPPASHLPLAHLSLEAGADVLVEKPLASSASEVAQLFDVAERNGRLLVENQNYRFNDEVSWLMSQIRLDRLGRIVEVETSMAIDLSNTRFADPNVPSPVGHLRGGAIRDFLPHLCGLVLALADEAAPADVRARWRNLSGNPALVHDELDATMELGSVWARIRFTGNTFPVHFRVAVRGSAGTASVDLFQPQRHLHVLRGPSLISPLLDMAVDGGGLVRSSMRNFSSKVLQHTPLHGIARLLEQFYAAAALGAPLPLRRDQIERSTALADAIASKAGDK